MWSVEFSPKSRKQINKLDFPIRKRILDWFARNIDGCEDPKRFGKGLTANRTGSWCYRIGTYRAIARIYDDKVIVQVLTIEHRSVVYRD